MRQDIAHRGTWGVDLQPNLNDNFNQLFQFPNFAIQNFISKIRSSKNVYKDNTIRVSVWADSIWNSYLNEFQLALDARFPNVDIEYKHAQLGGTGSDYHAALVEEIINYNPDLLIIEEYEGGARQAEIFESLLKRIREYTSASVLINPFPISGGDMDLLSNGNIAGFKASGSYIIRQYMYSLAAKYGCGVYDWDLKLIRDLINGDVTKEQVTADNVHRLQYFYDVYASDLFDVFFQELHLNEHLSISYTNKENSYNCADAVELSDITEIVSSGTFASQEINTDKTVNTLRSSTVSDYIEVDFDGVGVEIAMFGSGVGSVDVLVDGVAPSTLIKDYATAANNYLTGLHKIIVNSNILSNNETEREFLVTMTSATEYTLRDVTNAVDIRTGALITQDETFTVTGGELKIPANYASVNNWRGTITTGQTYSFSVKKNWHDTINITADSLTQVTRLFGLKKGSYKLRLTVASGTVDFDQIRELN